MFMFLLQYGTGIINVSQYNYCDRINDSTGIINMVRTGQLLVTVIE